MVMDGLERPFRGEGRKLLGHVSDTTRGGKRSTIFSSSVLPLYLSGAVMSVNVCPRHIWVLPLFL